MWPAHADHVGFLPNTNNFIIFPNQVKYYIQLTRLLAADKLPSSSESIVSGIVVASHLHILKVNLNAVDFYYFCL